LSDCRSVERGGPHSSENTFLDRGARGRRGGVLHDESDLCCCHERRQSSGAQIAAVRKWCLTELLGPAVQQDWTGSMDLMLDVVVELMP
jgi:hypothetical protein